MMKRPPFVRSVYNYDVDMASEDSGLSCGDESLCQQSFKEEVDVNTLVRRFHLTGEMPDDVRPVTYGDFTEIFDFHSAANAIATARENFEAMPAELRERFRNDPARFVAFCSDDKNLEEMRKLGLAVEARTPVADAVAPSPAPAPVDPAPSAPAKPGAPAAP